MRTFVAAFGVFALTALLAIPVQGAVLVNTPQALWFGGDVFTVLKLTNYETEINQDGGTPGTLEVGDRLRGTFIITSTNQVPGGSGATQRVPGPFELTGLFDILIDDIDGTGPNSLFEFVPYTPFADEIESRYGLGDGSVDGVMAVWDYDTTPEYNPTGGDSIATSEDNATDGSLFFALGSTGTWGVDYYWAANGSTDAVTSGVAAFAASLPLLLNNSGLNFSNVTQIPPDGFDGLGLEDIENPVAFQGNTRLNTEGGAYPIASQDPVLMQTVVPEPASLAIWSLLSVGGLALARRRRRA